MTGREKKELGDFSRLTSDLYYILLCVPVSIADGSQINLLYHIIYDFKTLSYEEIKLGVLILGGQSWLTLSSLLWIKLQVLPCCQF